MRIDRVTLFSLPVQAPKNLTRYGAAQTLDPALDLLVVKIETKCGLVGWGEVNTAPAYFSPELSSSAREGVRHVSPLLLGRDPRQISAIFRDVAKSLRGHGNAKTALEMALWDLAAKAHQMPLVDLWGGRVSEAAPIYSLVRIGTKDETLASLTGERNRGITRFQIKVGAAHPSEDIETIRLIQEAAHPHERVWYDANRGWLVDDAMRVLSAVRHLAPMIENPCETYEECLNVAKRTGLPFMLDEALDGPRQFIRAVNDQILDVATLKTSRVGGIEATRQAMTLATVLGVPVRIDDYLGTGIIAACFTHMALTLPENLIFGIYDFARDSLLPLVKDPFPVVSGKIRLPEQCAPGLGVEVDEGLLGKPWACLHHANAGN